MKMKGFTIWMSGLSGSGKSTIAQELKEQLKQKECQYIEILDGDEIRKELNWDLGFSEDDRIINLKRASFISKILSRNGVISIVAFISPYQEIRNYARSHNSKFLEVFINCPLNVCEKRDVKGLYQKARNGDIKDFTGVSHPFEKPDNPEIIIKTDNSTPSECAKQIIDKAIAMGYL